MTDSMVTWSTEAKRQIGTKSVSVIPPARDCRVPMLREKVKTHGKDMST
jgi:hypothetical protein